MIKNLIFDFGGVLCDLDFPKCRKLFGEIGFSDSSMTNEALSSGIFQRMNVGTIEERDFFSQLQKMSSHPNVTIQQLVDVWNTIIVDIPPQRFEALLALEKTYNLYLLSNTNITHWEYCLKNVWMYKDELFLRHFKQIFLSYVMHKEKPNTDIFMEVIQQTHILPEETLFIDDNLPNIEGAKKTGLHVLQALGDEWIDILKEDKMNSL